LYLQQPEHLHPYRANGSKQTGMYIPVPDFQLMKAETMMLKPN
jgi:hypothetical protein